MREHMPGAKPWSKTDMIRRFWDLVRNIGAGEKDCWEWDGKTNKSGYGRVSRGHRETMAHRVAYELRFGKIPTGLVIDHLCRNPRCVNPLHLEAVTNAENVLRGEGLFARKKRQTHCIRGHLLEGDSVRYAKNGTRHCRACERLRVESGYYRERYKNRRKRCK